MCAKCRASENGHLRPNTQSPDPGDCVDAPEKEECFELLRRCCCVKDGPSERPTWALFRTFERLLSHQLQKVEQYPLLGAAVASDGLEMFRCAGCYRWNTYYCMLLCSISQELHVLNSGGYVLDGRSTYSERGEPRALDAGWRGRRKWIESTEPESAAMIGVVAASLYSHKGCSSSLLLL